VHFALFAALAGTARRAAVKTRWLAPALVVYAVSSELIQASPLLGRSASVADVAADLLGAAVGLYLATSRP
jgi:VanZ family protein